MLRMTRFRGEVAAASLKHPFRRTAWAQTTGFRGEVAAASLKHTVANNIKHDVSCFRGEVAAASLKPRDYGYRMPPDLVVSAAKSPRPH